ncbi:MAG TPA: DUF996 domain-containing protein [Candidatus Glassbacteria bacterium]|nr:DUF996 domain-containing protein [Candidatus Glassbacteria bacterium]
MSFDSSKNLSAIGSLLMVIGFLGSVVPYAGILSIVGLILLLVGLKGLSSYYQENDIFNNTLYAIIIAIVGAVVAVATLIVTAVSAFATIGIDINNINDWTNFGTEIGTYFSDFANFSELWTLIGAVVLAMLVIFVSMIISMYFFRKTMTQLSTKSGIGLFGTAGLLMLIGAVLTIIAVGLLIIWIGLILATVAFFQMKEPQK